MPVYVDNARIPYGRMKMSHLVADTESELLSIAKKLGLQPRWHQFAYTWKSHFDVCASKREEAIRLGAIPVTTKEIVAIRARKRERKLVRSGRYP